MTKKEIFQGAAIMIVSASLGALVTHSLARRHAGIHVTHVVAPAESPKGGCVDFHDAQSHVGVSTCVSGRVVRAFTSRAGNAFLDFCPDYRHCAFKSVIFASDLPKFGDLEALVGRDVEIQGQITAYQGQTQIIIHDSVQIRVLP